MGSGASSYSRIQSDSSEEELGYSLRDFIAAPIGVMISSFLMNRRTSNDIASNITHGLMKTCVESWRVVAAQTYSANGKCVNGASMFAAQFFIELANMDVDNGILTKLQASNKTFKSRSPNSKVSGLPIFERMVLMGMLHFLLNIKDDSFATKTQIRSIGRKHARIGVRDESITIFNEAILRTLAVRLEPVYLVRQNVMRSWTVLLEFVRMEMTIEKVQFHNCNSGKITSSCHNQIALPLYGDFTANTDGQCLSSAIGDSQPSTRITCWE